MSENEYFYDEMSDEEEFEAAKADCEQLRDMQDAQLFDELTLKRKRDAYWIYTELKKRYQLECPPLDLKVRLNENMTWQRAYLNKKSRNAIDALISKDRKECKKHWEDRQESIRQDKQRESDRTTKRAYFTNPDIIKRRFIVAQNEGVQAAGICRLFDDEKIPVTRAMKIVAVPAKK
jgi:hypothetical protein